MSSTEPSGAEPSGADRIELRGLRVMGAHGALPEEQARAQPFEVDLDVYVDLAAASATDELSHTVDYGAVAERCAAVVERERHALLERLAGRIAEEVLGDERVEAVTVTIRKLRPPVAVALDHAAVRLHRSRLRGPAEGAW